MEVVKIRQLSSSDDKYYEMYVTTDSNDADYHYFTLTFNDEESLFFADICFDHWSNDDNEYGSWDTESIISDCEKNGIDIELQTDASCDDMKKTDEDFSEWLNESLGYMFTEDGWYSNDWGRSRLAGIEYFLYEGGSKYSIDIEY